MSPQTRLDPRNPRYQQQQHLCFHLFPTITAVPQVSVLLDYSSMFFLRGQIVLYSIGDSSRKIVTPKWLSGAGRFPFIEKRSRLEVFKFVPKPFECTVLTKVIFQGFGYRFCFWNLLKNVDCSKTRYRVKIFRVCGLTLSRLMPLEISNLFSLF